MALACLHDSGPVMRAGWRRLICVATAAAVLVGLLATGQVGAARQPSGRVVLGYYVPYDPTSWVSLAEHVDQLDMVAAQWVTVDGCGNLASGDDQTLKRLAQQHHVDPGQRARPEHRLGGGL